MKKNLINYAIKMMTLTVIAFTAMLKPAFCQEPAVDNDLITYTMAISADQQVKFRLPLDIRPGDRITGSVVEVSNKLLPYSPTDSFPYTNINSGKVADTQTKKSKSSYTLQGMVIEIDGKQTKLSNRLISFIVPAGLTSLPFLLKNSAGQIIEQGQIPIGIYSYFDDRWQEPVGGLGAKFSAQAVTQSGQPLNISGNFDGNAANTNVSLGGQSCDVIAESNRMSIVQVSENALAGVSNISIEEKGVTEEHKINIASLNLTANKTNLLKGEKATINVTINGLENLKTENLNYKLSLENLSPQTISFLKESGNVIEKEISAKAVKNGKYEFSTKIIAQSTGSFSVQALFFKPAGKNPCVDAYYDCIKFADEDYEYKSRNCTFYATGKKAPAATCQAQLIKEREERKAACLQQLRDCFK
jgi:heme/copper-type cytochrome/quinol oxidase subunit 4